MRVPMAFPIFTAGGPDRASHREESGRVAMAGGSRAKAASAVAWIAAACLVIGGSASAQEGFSTPPLTVVVRTVDGEPLPGAEVYLCKSDPESRRPPELSASACVVRGAGADGRAEFEVEERTRYGVTASLTGFAETTVFPLSFGPGAEPRAPGTIVVVLNPVCFDC